ncbi:cell division cycle-associated protein 3 isoform 2 [Gallus gallus]|uniref:Cell division cycle associated 3 n=1 Tax=Gallus gallus TaxID=9031 RepID=A0A1D5PA83_CHICK|nr:cell division cycle-associated protein 3 isoform 2 [Gallus gallus]|eukprot:NP_001265066.1 cell division cycle-associated protein 3 isoform 2 [Gallus gallus]
MGASGSAPATPVPGSLRNRHLAHVSDPRSPSAGILRTPIEVVSSPAGSPQPGPAQAGVQDADPRSPTPGIYRTPMKDTPSGGKHIRRKASNKILATSGGIVRSPFSILQDDNSPSAPVQRQAKKHILGENPGEKEVAVDLSRSLKAGNCAWSDLNKENQHCPFVEN